MWRAHAGVVVSECPCMALRVPRAGALMRRARACVCPRRSYQDSSVAYGRPAFASSSDASGAWAPSGVVDHDGFTACGGSATAWRSAASTDDEWVAVDLALTPAPRAGARNASAGVSIDAVHVVLGGGPRACGAYRIEVLSAMPFAGIRSAEGRACRARVPVLRVC